MCIQATAVGCDTHTLLFYHKLSFTCHPYNQREPCVNWNRASVNRHGWGAGKKDTLVTHFTGGVYFFCVISAFYQKKNDIHSFSCTYNVYTYIIHETRVPKTNPHISCTLKAPPLATAVHYTTVNHAHREEQPNIAPVWLFDYCFNEFIIILYIKKKDVYTQN